MTKMGEKCRDAGKLPKKKNEGEVGLEGAAINDTKSNTSVNGPIEIEDNMKLNQMLPVVK